MLDKTLDHLSYSCLAAYRRCPRLFFYRYAQNLRRSGGAALPLVGGSALHSGTAEWWRSGDADEAQHRLRETYFERAGEVSPLALARPGAVTEKWSYLTVEHCEAVLETYMEADHLSGFELYREMPMNLHGVESIEAEEDAGLSEARIRYRLLDDLPPFEFRVDALLEDSSGALHLVDRKCKTSWLNDYSIRLSIGVGHQLRLYQGILERLLDREIEATWIEGIYMGEPPKSGWKRVKSEPLALFGPWSWTSEELDETFDWARTTAEDIAVAVERAERYVGKREEAAFAQNDNGGCPNCSFFELCEVPPSSRAAAIERDYEPRVVEEETSNE